MPLLLEARKAVTGDPIAVTDASALARTLRVMVVTAMASAISTGKRTRPASEPSHDWDRARWARRALPRRIIDDEVPGRAAQMSFYFFLSVFPTLLILMAVLGLFLDAQWLVRETLLEQLGAMAPAATVRVFTRLLDHLAGRAPAPLTWDVVLAL